MLGHDGPPTYYWRENLISGEQLAECPLRTALRSEASDPALIREIERHQTVYLPAYDAGHLLVGGGISKQPARYLAFMNTLTALREKQQTRYAELTAPTSESNRQPVS